MTKHFKRKAALACISLMLGGGGGCYRQVSYTSPEGRELRMTNIGFDTRLGRLTAETGDGRVEIEGAESEAASATRLAELIADLARHPRRSAP